MPRRSCKDSTDVIPYERDRSAVARQIRIAWIAQVVAEERLAGQPDGQRQDAQREQQREPEGHQLAFERRQTTI